MAPPVVTGFLTIDTLLAGDCSGFADALWHLALPSFVLGWAVMGIISRLVRASMLDVLSQDYVLMARAKGAGELRVLFNHALRNALIPTLTVIGFSFAYLITGAVLTETIFSWPGIGSYAVYSARSLDYPAIMGVTIVGAPPSSWPIWRPTSPMWSSIRRSAGMSAIRSRGSAGSRNVPA